MTRYCRYGNVAAKLEALVPKITSIQTARMLFSDWLLFSDTTREHLWVAHLDKSGRCVHFTENAGDAGSVSLPIAEIVFDAISSRATGIVLAHNHPSGDPRPSDSDCRFTRKLCAVLNGLDCNLLDHLIFAGGDCTSFRAAGLL